MTIGTTVYACADLSNSTTYTFRVRAYNDGGQSGYSATTSGITAQRMISPFPYVTMGDIIIQGQKANGIFNSSDTVKINFQGSSQSQYTFTLSGLDTVTQNTSSSPANVDHEIINFDLTGKKSGIYNVNVTGSGINKTKRIMVIE